ncbi:fluoride efflux transporter CrcB [Candidatus Solirubrobacter pratensis]|uniref:fluoride efflux transporter CrcB n=1 Tax=Candidatus Solirubrobacter pratensis TaxID=1298857 RepID=UPI0003FC8AA6|nr:fluoride efflux transporter CrcB [Candidatus Solirubrobacter pratensis]
MIVWIGVALLGGAGACARFLLDGAIASGAFPNGTLAVNLSGAFLLGLLAGADVTGDAYLLAGTAALGAYTTFSTWMFESQRAAEEGRSRAAILNLVLSAALGLATAALGRAIGGAL